MPGRRAFALQQEAASATATLAAYRAVDRVEAIDDDGGRGACPGPVAFLTAHTRATKRDGEDGDDGRDGEERCDHRQ